MTTSLIGELADAVQMGRAVASATVVDTDRSVPRHAGAKMLVFADGRISGTIGGGEMESRVTTESVAALADGRPRLLSYSLLDPASGDPGVCGGTVQVFVEPHMPQPTLLIVGFGHVGQAVASLANWLGFTVIANDDRADLASDSHDLESFVVGPVDALLRGRDVGSRTAVVVVTRSTALDIAALPHLLATDAGYIGVMGSQRRWQTTRSKLAEAGLDDAALDRVHAPIGLEVNAETPEEIAVSVMAEVLGSRNG
ncbi:MAG: XdhC family protein [Actinomycetia bacterium]|nr:XdhC family protein [Actinomycetes bacterium]